VATATALEPQAGTENVATATALEPQAGTENVATATALEPQALAGLGSSRSIGLMIAELAL
jgi:hypothetical protein